MADNRRTSEYRKLLPLIAKASGDIGDDTVGEDVQALLQALEAHKTSADHDGRYYTESEIDNLLLGTVGNNITLTAGLGLTGGGDLSANRRFDVGAGNGITVGEDTVSVDLNYNFTWMGIHSFQNITYASSIMPHISDVYDLGSSASLWRNIWASELSAIVFAQYTQVLLGGWFTVSKGEGVLEAAVSTSATSILLDSSSVDIGDIIVFRGLSSTGNPQVEYMKITGKSGTTYSVTRNLDGSGANAWPAGSVYANYGTTGNGRIELNAYDTPRISVFSHANTIAGYREQVRIGDLINGWGYSTSTYGSAFGAYESGKANITIDPTNGVRIRNYNQTIIQLTGTEASFENVIKLGTYGRLQQGTGTWGSNFTGSAIWNESGIMNIGGWNNNAKQWWGGSDGKFYAGDGDVIIDSEGLRINSPLGMYGDTNSLKFSNDDITYYTMVGDGHAFWTNLESKGMYPAEKYDTIQHTGGSTGARWRTLLKGMNYGSINTNGTFDIKSYWNDRSIQLDIETDDWTDPQDVINRGRVAIDGYIDGAALSTFDSRLTLTAYSNSTGYGEKSSTIDLWASNTSYSGTRWNKIDLNSTNINLNGIVSTTGGVHVGGTSDPGDNNLVVDGTIKDGSGNLYGRPVFLTTPKTSTSWDGDSYSTTAKTKIDLSEVFGVPAGVKAVLVRLTARDSGSSAGYCQFSISPNNTADSVAVQAYLQGVANDVYVSVNGVVPCDANGDVYYQITASGTETLEAFIEIWGWWL